MASETLQTVERGFLVLELLAQHESMGVREIAAQTKLNTTVVHRIVTTLQTLGYVAQNTATEKYQLTYKILAVGSGVAQRNPVVALAHSSLANLAEACKETVHFVQRVGGNIRYIDKITPAANMFATGSYVGMELPMAATAVGKAILAQLPPQEVEEIWHNSEIVRHTPHTICSLSLLQQQLAETRETGFAYDKQERELGLFCIGVSLLNYKGEPEYGISISAPMARMQKPQIQLVQQQLLQCKMQIAALISK